MLLLGFLVDEVHTCSIIDVLPVVRLHAHLVHPRHLSHADGFEVCWCNHISWNGRVYGMYFVHVFGARLLVCQTTAGLCEVLYAHHLVQYTTGD